VASSKMNREGFLRMARAMAMRCFWPPEIWAPPAPRNVSMPFYILLTNSKALACFSASIIYYSVASYLAKSRF
jgi:hypothetical protein